MRTVFWKKLQILGAAFLCAILTSEFGAAQQECFEQGCATTTDEGQQTIRVGYTQFPPFSKTTNAGLAEGYFVDLMRLLAEPLGYTLQFVPHDNPAELLESIEAGRIDATSPLSFNADRKTYGSFTQSVHTFSFNAFTTRGGPSITDVGDLAELRVGVSQGSQAERRMRTIEGTIVVPFDSSDDLLLPLLAGEIDAVAAPSATIYYQIARAGLGSRIERSEIQLNQFDAGFLVQGTQGKLLQDLDFAISHAQSQGHIQDLYDEWFRPAPDPLTQRESLFVLVTASAVTAILLYWGWLHYGVRLRARHATERAESLQEVLSATGATLLIADKNMRPLWWNDAYERNYPEQMHLLERGAALKEIFAAKTVDAANASETGKGADQQIAELLATGETLTIDHAAGGRVLESKSVKLASGQFGVVAMDMSARNAALEELQINATRLLEANRNLSEFSHVAAHDLAGPLRSIRNLHKWILDDISEAEVKLEADVIENFEHIDRLIERQSALIDDLLAYASSDGLASSRAFDANVRWASVLDLCEIPSEFKVSVPEDFPLLSADPVGFDIAIRNLISNAVKHHDQPSGQIKVSHQIEGGFLRVRVTDDGPGIEAKYQQMIFQPFKTLKSRDRGGGTGLGLAFVERTVSKWGGHVSVVSDPSARETTFSFTVPLAKNATDQEKVVKLRAG